MFQDSCVHRIRGQIQFAGPGDRAVFKGDLRKERGVGKRGKDSSLCRMNQAGHVYCSSETVGKCYPQLKLWKGFNFRHAPSRPWCDCPSQGRGGMFVGN